jgi:hypothetical protein
MTNTEKVKEMVSIIMKTSDLEVAKMTMGMILKEELSFTTKVTFTGNVANIYIEEGKTDGQWGGEMKLLTVDLS